MTKRFDELIASAAKDGLRLNQHVPEWRAFMEYAAGYFAARGITRPLVVEIGVLDGAQRRFYEGILGAEHIGIDIRYQSPADIIGDSSAPGTITNLKKRIGGRMIDLLFIDGLHTYVGAKADFDNYGPLTRHIIAIHDIHTPKLGPKDTVDVTRLWSEILTTNKADTIITIQAHNPRRPEEFNGRQLGIGIIVKGASEAWADTPPLTMRLGACPVPIHETAPKVSVISRMFNEAFFLPYFLSHYAWADEIIILLEKSTEDRSAEIIGRFPNARIEWTDNNAVLDDRKFSGDMSDLAASLKSDWVVRADADELIFAPGDADPREALARADGNVVNVLFHWVYRHRTDADLDPAKPALWQRRHGGAYTIWPGMGPTFTKPSIVRPSSGIRWRPGEQGYEPNGNIRLSTVRFEGAHWQMVDADEAVRRLLSAEKRLSETNRANNWGVRRFTESQIRRECAAHLDDPAVI